MNFPISCPRCVNLGLKSKQYFVAYQDSGRYVVPCEKGHQDITVLVQQKFEVLFEIGANAILDGYFREAISSFTSSMERTFEFFVKAVFYEKGMFDEMDEFWKQIANQSERQLGAFLAIYSLVIGIQPKLLPNKHIQFRNEVIHKGKIPTRGEAIAYGQAVLDIVRTVIKCAQTSFPNGVTQTIVKSSLDCRHASDPPDLIAGFGAITILNLTVTGDTWHDRTLEKALHDLAQIRRNLMI